MFEQVFKNIDDVLWKDAGCTSELDYTEQSSWLLFLKYLDALEHDKAMEAQLEGKKYTFILDRPYRWESWAAPKGKDGRIDHNTAATGDDLLAFVNQKLFPYPLQRLGAHRLPHLQLARNRNPIEFLGIWDQINNPGFNPIEFEGIRKDAGLNSFILTARRWIEQEYHHTHFP